MPELAHTNDQDFSAGAAWMDGEIVPIGQAAIPVTDWGLTHSDITYDVVHVWDHRFFRMDDYITRFLASVDKCRLSIPQGRDDIRKILHDMVAKTGLERSYVSMVASRGQPGMLGSRDPRDCVNYFYAWCVPFVWVFTEDVLERGASLLLPDDVHRIGKTSVDPTAKNYHWGDFTQGLMAAKEQGFDNVVLLDQNGFLTEGPGFNLFIVKDGAVKTPRSGVLEGITRRTAIEICAAEGLSCEEADITATELMEADEVFATTTGGGPVAIARTNDRVFSNASWGEITRRLNTVYWQWHERDDLSEAVGSL